MGGYLFFSHDGFGLGHVRRNLLIARALRDTTSDATVTIVTGIGVEPRWLRDGGVEVVKVPPLLKDERGFYRGFGLTFEETLDLRSLAFRLTLERIRPDVVVIDRHPYGIGGELREGLRRAHDLGAAVVLGLRDVLDEPEVVADEVAGKGWDGVGDAFDEVLVYGAREFCDHEAEYGLPVTPAYCGWVTDTVRPTVRDASLLAVAAGGGGDGAAVFRLGLALAERRPHWRTHIAAGPYSDSALLRDLVSGSVMRDHVIVETNVAGCAPLFSVAGAVLQMAGYNSTFEALSAGHRAILVPRRSPRREQAIRAHRLAALGLADVVDEEASAAEIEWLLDQPRHLDARRVIDAGIRLDGARCVAGRLLDLAAVRSAR